MDRRLCEDIHHEDSIPAIRLPIGLRPCCTRHTVRHGCLASVTNGSESHAISKKKRITSNLEEAVRVVGVQLGHVIHGLNIEIPITDSL